MALDYAVASPPGPFNRKRFLGCATGVVAGVALLLGGWMLAYTMSTSPTRRVHQDIDLRSGRVRVTHYYRWFRTGRQITLSPV